MKSSVFDSVLLSERIWLPTNVTWDEVFNRRDFRYPNVVELFSTFFWSIPLTFIIRYLLIRFAFTPLGHRFKVKATRSRKLPFNLFLEETYLKLGTDALKTDEVMNQMMNRTGLDKDKIHLWFKFRWAQDEIPDLDKFTEDCWMAVIHASLTVCGYNATAQNSCLYDIDSCWEHLPYQNATHLQEFFYKMAMTCLVVDSAVLLVKRHESRDILMRLYHHIITFLLMLVSWITNSLRIGCVILFLLESTSPLVFVGKVAEWIRIKNLSRIVFMIVTVQWFAVRIAWYNFIALPGILIRRHYHLSKPARAFFFSDFFLLLLLIVNLHYARLIVKKVGGVVKGEFFKLNLSDESWSDIANKLEANEPSSCGENKPI